MAAIVLDPGHGGTKKVGNSSPNNAVGPTGLLEKTVTLDLALRAEQLLLAAGHAVTLTRRTDVNLGLADRAKVGKDAKADVFLSIHLNGFNGKVQGTETICDNVHSAASGKLCLAVQKALLSATGYSDRNNGGVKTQSLGVLKQSLHAANTACCLAEISFMDVPAEEDRLKKDVYRQKVAKSLVSGITAYLAKSQALEMPKAEKAAGFEDGFAAMSESPSAAVSKKGGPKVARKPAKKSGSKAPSRVESIAQKPEVGFDRAEFAIVSIGEGFKPEATELALESPAAAASAFDQKAFEAYVQSLGLRYLSARELLFLGASNAGGPCAGTNSLPPESLWKNIGKTARMLDEIRHQLGAPVTILSAYRAPAYNSCIGGESKSLHMKFNAIDFKCSTGTAAQWHKKAVSVRASSSDFLGGIGKYASFVHIDTRGYKADW